MTIPPAAATVLLLAVSNLFMNAAWYGHLKHKDSPLWLAILASWGIAFFEYCLAVPANRIGSTVLTAPQLKGIQELMSILTFAAFTTLYLGQPLSLKQWAGFALVVAGVFLVVEA